MIEDPTLEKIYRSLATTLPKGYTDRASDLDRLMEVEGCFALCSVHRNGTTSLLRELARQKDGVYLDAMMLGWYDRDPPGSENFIRQFERHIGEGEGLVIIDEVASFFARFMGYEIGMDYLGLVAKNRPVGIRVHPFQYDYRGDMVERGFEIVDVGKIPYDEFTAIFGKVFSELTWEFPERYIDYAHGQYDALAKSVLYVMQAFKMMAENELEEPDEEEVRRRVHARYCMFDDWKEHKEYWEPP